MTGTAGRFAPALAGATFVAAVLRFATLDVQSFDGDELYTAWLAGLPFGDMLRGVRATESTPYLYYAIVWAWRHVAGDGEVALRSLSALAGTAAVPLGGLAAARLASRRAGAFAAALLAVAPVMVWFSQQARAYAFLTLWSALGLWLFARAWLDGDRRALAGWSATAAVALATHYFAVFFFAPQVLWLLWAAHRGSGPPLRSVAGALVAPVVAVGALSPLAWSQRHNPSGIGDASLLERLAQVPKELLVAFSAPHETLVTVAAAALVAGALLALLRAGPNRLDDGVAVAAGLTVATVGVPLLLAALGADYLATRNVLPALLPAAVVVGAGLAASRYGQALVAGLVALSLVIHLATVLDARYRRADWRGAAQAAGPARAARTIVMQPNGDAGPFNVYFAGSGPLREDVPVAEILTIALASEGRYSTATPRPPRPPTPRPPHGFHLVERRNAAGYTLVRYRTSRPRALIGMELGPLLLNRRQFPGLWLQRPR